MTWDKKDAHYNIGSNIQFCCFNRAGRAQKMVSGSNDNKAPPVVGNATGKISIHGMFGYFPIVTAIHSQLS
jgi:hypothetical protein